MTDMQGHCVYPATRETRTLCNSRWTGSTEQVEAADLRARGPGKRETLWKLSVLVRLVRISQFVAHGGACGTIGMQRPAGAERAAHGSHGHARVDSCTE